MTGRDPTPEAVRIPPPGYAPDRDGVRAFRFMDEARYPCFPLGSTWNGFDNVSVSPETRDLVAADWKAIPGFDPCTVAELLAIEPGEDGRICLGWGYATELDDG